LLPNVTLSEYAKLAQVWTASYWDSVATLGVATRVSK
jgi:hypothetical protein